MLRAQQDSAQYVASLESSIAMCEAALGAKSSVLDILLHELHAARKETEVLARMYGGQVIQQPALPSGIAGACRMEIDAGFRARMQDPNAEELALSRQECAELREENARLRDMLQQEEHKCCALETELAQTADAAMELWQSVANTSDTETMPADAVEEHGSWTCDAAGSPAGSYRSASFACMSPDQQLHASPVLPTAVGMMTPVEQRLAALSTKLLVRR